MYTEEKALKKIKRVKRIKRLTVLLIVITILTAILFSPFFSIKHVEINNMEQYSYEHLLQKSGFVPGENVFKTFISHFDNLLGMGFVKQKTFMEALPYVKSADIEYSVPNTIQIHLTAREGIALIAMAGNYLLVDADGFIIDVLKEKDERYPLLEGLKFKAYELGKHLETERVDDIDTVVKLLDLTQKLDSNDPYQLYPLIDTVEIKDDNQVLISLDKRVIVNLGGKKELEYKLKFLKVIIFENHIQPDARGLIDFTKGVNPSFIPEN